MKSTYVTQALACSLIAGMPLTLPAETAAPVATLPATNQSSPVPYDAGFVRFLVPSASTQGKTAVLELQEMPGFQTPWHQHKNFDETFYVVEGTLTLRLQDKILELPAGSSVFIPRGTAHAQGNSAQEAVKVLTIFTPGGFDQFFRDRAELFKHAKRGSPEFAEGMRQLREKHAQWIQEPDPTDTHP